MCTILHVFASIESKRYLLKSTNCELGQRSCLKKRTCIPCDIWRGDPEALGGHNVVWPAFRGNDRGWWERPAINTSPAWRRVTRRHAADQIRGLRMRISRGQSTGGGVSDVDKFSWPAAILESPMPSYGIGKHRPQGKQGGKKKRN